MTGFEAYQATREQYKADIRQALGWDEGDPIYDGVKELGQQPQNVRRYAVLGPLFLPDFEGMIVADYNTGGSAAGGTSIESWPWIVIVRFRDSEVGGDVDGFLAQCAFRLRNQIMSRAHHTDGVDSLHIVKSYGWYRNGSEHRGWYEAVLTMEHKVVLGRFDPLE